MNKDNFIKQLNDLPDRESFKIIKEIRKNFLQFNNIELKNSIPHKEVKNIVLSIVTEIAKNIKKSNYNIGLLPASHGLGHIVRDFKSSLMLIEDKRIWRKIDSTDLIIGTIAGIFHDIGLLIVPRYEENLRILRHGECGALLIKNILENSKIIKTLEKKYGKEIVYYIKTGIVYGISSHSNYQEIKIRKITIPPYIETWKNSRPIWPVVIPRWVDRMDCIGPYFVCRHFLSMTRDHMDYDGDKFIDFQFENHMKPKIIDGTMRNHIITRANSQTDKTRYGKYDIKNTIMTEYRSFIQQRTYILINTLDEKPKKLISKNQLFNLLKNKVAMCDKNCDKSIKELINKFYKLDASSRDPWLNVFTLCEKMIELHSKYSKKENNAMEIALKSLK